MPQAIANNKMTTQKTIPTIFHPFFVDFFIMFPLSAESIHQSGNFSKIFAAQNDFTIAAHLGYLPVFPRKTDSGSTNLSPVHLPFAPIRRECR